MNDDEFYTTVGTSDFVGRYYALCNRYPVRDLPVCQISNSQIKEILSELGLSARWDPRDGSFSFDRILAFATVHLGFVIQNQATLEFWFWLQQSGRRLGNNYAAIAFETAKQTGKTLSDPQYPRPEFRSVDELRRILTECFGLAEVLMLSLSKTSSG